MRALFSLLSHVGVFAIGAFLISFALLLAGAVAQLVYKINLQYFNQL